MSSRNIFITIFIVTMASFLAYGYFNATPGVENGDAKIPKIVITPQVFDFGQIDYGQVAKYSFKVENLGDQVLEIKKVATSCACTSAQVIPEKIEPGQEAELKVTYDTSAMSGPHGHGQQERIIYVKSNDPVNPQVEVIIQAYVQ